MGNSSKKMMILKKFSTVVCHLQTGEPGTLAVFKPEMPGTGVASLKPQPRSARLAGCPRSNKSALPPILLPTHTGLPKEATSLVRKGLFS